MDSGFRPVTDDELDLIRSCGPGERCLIYEDEFFKLSLCAVTSMLESAFNNACADALELAGGKIGSDEFQFEVDPLGVGQTWMRVTLTTTGGDQFSAIGLIPDPRGNQERACPMPPSRLSSASVRKPARLRLGRPLREEPSGRRTPRVGNRGR